MRNRYLPLFLVVLGCLASNLQAQLGQFADAQVSGSQDNNEAFQYRLPVNKTSNVQGPIPSNRWWSALLVQDEVKMISPYPLFYSACVKDYPAEGEGFGIAVGYRGRGKAIVRDEPDTEVPRGQVRTVEADVQRQLLVWNRAMDRATTRTRLQSFGDWHVVTETSDASQRRFFTTMTAGSPYTFFVFENGQPKIRLNSRNAQLEFKDGNKNSVLTSNGSVTTDRLMVRIIDPADQSISYWGLYSTPGTVWKRIGEYLEVDVAGETRLLNTALLSRAEDFDLFQQHAYAKIVGTQASYRYDEAQAKIQTDFLFSTQLQRAGFRSEVLTALFPHQHKNLTVPLDSSLGLYPSMRGNLRLWRGKQFSTSLRNEGILFSFNRPSGSEGYNYEQHKQFTQWESYVKEAFGTDTYGTGKALQRAGASLAMTETLDMPWLTQEIMDGMYKEFAEWFTANSGVKPIFWGDNRPYKFFSSFRPGDGHWGHLTGWRASYGTQALNDIHFHSGYWIYGAAFLAKYHPTFYKDYGWAVEALIRNMAAPTRNDSQFPYLRVFDPYTGRSYASGYYWYGGFNGNDLESTSESLNAWQAVFQWGQITGQKQYRDLGLYLYWTERSAVEQYWFDIDGDVHHPQYAFPFASVLREGSYDFATHWGSRQIEELFGIQMLPLTPATLHLARHHEYMRKLWDSMSSINRAQRGVDFDTWHGTMLSFEALVDADKAVSRFKFGEMAGNPGAEYSPIQDHETWSLVYQFIHSIHQLGLPVTGYWADSPSYGVFEKNQQHTFVGFNPSRDKPLTIHFYGTQGLVYTMLDIPPMTTVYSK